MTIPDAPRHNVGHPPHSFGGPRVKTTMAPRYAEPSNKSVVREHSVQQQYWSSGKIVSSYLRRLSLRFLLEQSSPPRTGRMDPAGLEPASATWTECRAPIAPRALTRVSRGCRDRCKDVSHTVSWSVSNREAWKRNRETTMRAANEVPRSKTAKRGAPWQYYEPRLTTRGF